MSQFPLDMAAQVTLIAWTLQELPELEDRITPLLRQALDFAGIRDIEALKVRKLDGLSIYDQQLAFPAGGDLDLAALRDEIRALAESLPQIVSPPGLSIPAGLVRSPWAVAFPATSSFTADLEVIVTQALLSADWVATSSFTADLQVISPVNLAATFAGTSSFTADLEAIAPTGLAVAFTGTSSFTADLEAIAPINLAATFAGTSSFTADLDVSTGPPVPVRRWTSEQGISFDGNWRVHEWRDTIANALLNSNSATTRVPELVDGGIGFDGVDDMMISEEANLQVGTIIIAYRQRANSSGGALLSARANNAGGKVASSSETIHLGNINSSSDAIYAIGGANQLNVNNSAGSVGDFTNSATGVDPGNLNTIHIVGFTRPNSDTGSKAFVVGADAGGAIGTGHINAVIYEILLYQTQLSSSDLNEKVDELVAKYNPATRDGDFEQFVNAHTAVNSTLTTTARNVVAGAISTLKAQNRWNLLDEIYVMLGSNKIGQMSLRLKPVITAASRMPVENVSNPNPTAAFTSQGVEFGTDVRFIRSNNLSELGSSNSFSFGVYVNRAAGTEAFGTYAVVGGITPWGIGNSGIGIGHSSTAEQNLGNHGGFIGVSFSNQALLPGATGLFAFSGTQGAVRRPYINGARMAEGPAGNWNGSALPFGFTGDGNTRIAGGYACRSLLSDADHAALYQIFQSLNAALGRATATPAPFRVQAEDFVAAFDSTPGDNQGGQYRPVGPNNPGVDIGNTGIGGSFNIGWTASGEWLEYNVNIPVTGTYNIRIPTSMNGSGTQMRVLIDGSEIALINVPNTGSWTVWTNNFIYNVSLTAGTKLLRIEFAVGGFDLDFFEFIGVSV